MNRLCARLARRTRTGQRAFPRFLPTSVESEHSAHVPGPRGVGNTSLAPPTRRQSVSPRETTLCVSCSELDLRGPSLPGQVMVRPTTWGTPMERRTRQSGRKRTGGISGSFLAALGSLSPAISAATQDWYVDVHAPECALGAGTQLDPFCGIQAAVDAASNGDTIHISPGIYPGNVLIDKDLELIGTGGREITILDGMASGSVIRVRDSSLTMSGLTLTNGTGTPQGVYGALYGGGLFVYSPLGLKPAVDVSDSTVTGNAATKGGGIAHGRDVLSGVGGGALVLTNTTISSNTMKSHPPSLIHPYLSYYVYAGGGGIWSVSDGSVTLVNSAVRDNHGVRQNPGYDRGTGSGGGIAALEVTLTNSVVAANTARVGGGVTALNAALTESTVSANTAWEAAGGIWGIADVTLTNTTVSDNTAGAVYGGPYLRGRGGGISSYGSLTVDGSRVTGNIIGNDGSPSGPLMGAGIFTLGEASILNSLITANGHNPNGSTYGGGIWVGDYQTSASLTLTSSTAAGNGRGDVIVYGYYPVYASSAVVNNSILLRLGSGHYASVAVSHSLVEGGWPGTGNIDADPLFVDPGNGDYRLSPGSPCIDAGRNSSVWYGTTHDLRGAPRFLDDPLTPDTGIGPAPIVDMGAYEFYRRIRDARGVSLTPVDR